MNKKHKKNTKKQIKTKIKVKTPAFSIPYLIYRYIKLNCRILRMAIVDTIRQDGIEHAGYLAFLSILSLFPFLIFLVSIIGHLGSSEACIKFISLALDSLPEEVSLTLTPRINEILSEPPHTLLTIAAIGIIWTASSSVEGCRTILNRAYRIEFPPPYIFRRLVSVIEFFAIIITILIGILSFIAAPNLMKLVGIKFNFALAIDNNGFGLRYFGICLLLFCAVSLFYYILPSAKQAISQTIPGSILTVTLWVVVEKFFSHYLQNFYQFNFVYGSMAGVIISLMFFYVINLIFILGAEFNYHFHRTFNILLK